MNESSPINYSDKMANEILVGGAMNSAKKYRVATSLLAKMRRLLKKTDVFLVEEQQKWIGPIQNSLSETDLRLKNRFGRVLHNEDI